MPQEATIKQKRFAQGIALGKPKTVAYKLAYPNSKLKGKSLATEASTTSRSKAVAQELERLLAEPMLKPLLLSPCPEFQDHIRLREHAVGTMVKLSNHDDPLVAFHAAQWLFDYSKLVAEERKARHQTNGDAMAKLREIYSKALPSPPLVVEVEANASGAGGSEDSSPGLVDESQLPPALASRARATQEPSEPQNGAVSPDEASKISGG